MREGVGMKLTKFFDESAIHAKQLVALHDAFEFSEKRTRSEWRDKLFDNGIVGWGKRAGVWRATSPDGKILIVGTDTKESFLTDLIDWRPMMLLYALTMMLAAIDKILHFATTSNRFVQLLKTGKLDSMMKNFPVSEAYGIAMKSRMRRGFGGKTKPRPANMIKEVVSSKLYESSFLAVKNLETICSANGESSIFKSYAEHLNRKGAEPLKERWRSICKKRNSLVHECNIVRTKISPKNIRFNPISSDELKKDIGFIEDFGKFLADKLEK